LTTSESCADAVPYALAAVIVYRAIGVTAIGVPEMVPVVVLKSKPAGDDGPTEYFVTEPATPASPACKIGVPKGRKFEPTFRNP
jgi:hypothetical protein